MPKFGAKSLAKLAEVHPDLQAIAEELIKVMDVTILCGFRNEQEQQAAFVNGTSKLQWPRSKHNKQPAMAIDLAPYPVDWKDLSRFAAMCNQIERIAAEQGIKIRLGRDFSFKDWPHLELHDKHVSKKDKK